MSNEISFNNLIYYYKRPNLALISFIGFRDPVHVMIMLKLYLTLCTKQKMEYDLKY